MKLTAVITSVLIIISFTLAFLSEGDPNYGKTPAFLLASGFSAVIIFLSSFIVGLIIRDKILIISTVSVFVALLISIFSVGEDTNTFGAFWGGLIIVSLLGVIGFVTSTGRLIYLVSRRNPNACSPPSIDITHS